MKGTIDRSPHAEPLLTARLAATSIVAAAILLTVSLAILLARVVTMGTSSLLLAAGGLVVLAAILVIGLPLLDRLPASRRRPRSTTASRGAASDPRPVGQPVRG